MLTSLTAVIATTTDPKSGAYTEANPTKHDASADSRRVKAADKAWTAAAELLAVISCKVDHAEPLTSPTTAAAVGISTKASAVLEGRRRTASLVRWIPSKVSRQGKGLLFHPDLAEDQSEDQTEDGRGSNRTRAEDPTED